MNNNRERKSEPEQTVLAQALSSLEASSGLSSRITTAQNRQRVAGGDIPIIKLGAKALQWSFSAVVKNQLTNGALGYVIADLKQERPQRGVLVTRYVSPQQAEKLRQANVQFLDTAGNAFLNQPPLYVFVTGNRLAEKESKVRTTRAFTATGIKVLFALLCNPMLAASSYREISAVANVSLGQVSQVMDDLKRAGYLLNRPGQGRTLRNDRELIRRWGEAYAERLRPKLIISRFSAEKADWWKEARLEKMEACWGGEVAAAKLTRYLKPQVKTIYAPNQMAALQVKYKLRHDEDGEIELLRKFWTFEDDFVHTDVAPALLVYADLMASGDERNQETAEMIYDQHIARSFGKT